jgi:hypothetical protein
MSTAREKRVAEAQRALADLGLPHEQRNERAALTLLALLDLKPNMSWAEVRAPLVGVTPIMDFVAQHYDKQWAPNTRETVRRFTLHQFVQAGLVVPNPDKPDRPTNSPSFCYQIEAQAAEVLRKFGSDAWGYAARLYVGEVGALADKYAQEREMRRIPLKLEGGKTIALTPGGQNELVRLIVEEFCARFTPGATPVYVGDTGEKWAYFDEALLRRLGVHVESHGKMPDVVVHFTQKNWLILVEAVTSHGPVSPKRLTELKALFEDASAGLVFVTAFLDRDGFTKYMDEIAWETEVWVAQSPSHMIHFNGERFLGPYSRG